ncbi:SRPBCC family protein [Actinomadura sp. ATCC 31491]|uniref:SRPBCC family protein n=1 Tax=Actinomadura luzonensis TaxID=2805427 RepID=A0ABT0G6N6_9ACTN|nr:SRPBCC family protein [Actinomadura luzonensis]MCK2220271.1 SRPBCC family protein [Actinomadura luzonensis]
MPTRFEVVTLVHAPPGLVFDTSLSVEAHTESMAGARERAVAGVTTGRLGPGDRVTWRARHFGLPWRLTSVISGYERPAYFMDEQVAGPFRRWRHAHHFVLAPDGRGTVMRDVVEFAAPAGPLGTLAEALVLRRYMTRLILRRNAHLKRVTEAAAR